MPSARSNPPTKKKWGQPKSCCIQRVLPWKWETDKGCHIKEITNKNFLICQFCRWPFLRGMFFFGLPFLKGFPVISEKLKVTVSPEFPGVKLVNDVTTPLPIIVADAHRITQLIYNLVTNAIKFFGGELLRVVRFWIETLWGFSGTFWGAEKTCMFVGGFCWYQVILLTSNPSTSRTSIENLELNIRIEPLKSFQRIGPQPSLWMKTHRGGGHQHSPSLKGPQRKDGFPGKRRCP